MRITFSQFKKLPVQTRSGIYLGRVVDAVLSAEDNIIVQYEVRSHKIVGRTFLINNSQVVEVGADKIVVEDAVSADLVSKMVIPINQLAEN